MGEIKPEMKIKSHKPLNLKIRQTLGSGSGFNENLVAAPVRDNLPPTQPNRQLGVVNIKYDFF